MFLIIQLEKAISLMYMAFHCHLNVFPADGRKTKGRLVLSCTICSRKGASVYTILPYVNYIVNY